MRIIEIARSASHRAVFSAAVFALAGMLLPCTATPAAAAMNERAVAVTADSIDYGISPQRITNDCIAATAAASRRMLAVEKIPLGRADFNNTIVELENTQADTNDMLVAAQFLGSVSSDRSTRDASDRCQNSVNKLFSDVSTRPGLAARVRAVAARRDVLGRADAKLLETWRRGFERSGATLSEGTRHEIGRLNDRINELETAYSANLANSTPTISLARSQTAGLPADFLGGLERGADGSYTVPVNESTDERFLANAADEGARRAYLFTYGNRGYPENLPVLRETLAIRLRLAHLLGERTWADYVLADRMAANPARVRRFLDDLDTQLLPPARAQIERLAALKAHDTHTASAVIAPWDVAYYHEKLRRTAYNVDTDAVRRYFPVDHTINAVLGIYSRLLGIRFTRVVAMNSWSPDVLEFRVYDAAGGALRGTLYLDLYPRPGKYTHFASFPLVPARRRGDGTYRPPVDAIVGNWSRPASGTPALLSHDEVQTFFHEFGHAMATILARTPYESLSSGFRTDFVEAPSQMLENWVWNPSVLRELSANVDDGQPMPDDLIAKIIAARYVDEAYFTTRQILYADIDLSFHSASPPSDTTGRWMAVASRVTPVGFVPGTHPEAAFGHIMGGYDAGYYGYLWSKVYAQDLFTAFASAGLENGAVGARYRSAILEPAREIEPDEEVRTFLGRPMSTEAFYRDLGIKVPTH